MDTKIKTLRQELKKSKKLDLNLLPIFSQVFKTGNVTHTAKTLDISAPAVSRHLNKLREYFSDPLFVREGQHLAATVMAQEIYQLLNQDIERLMRLLNSMSQSDVMDKVVLHSTPYLSMRVIPELSGILWEKNAKCEIIHKGSTSSPGIVFKDNLRFHFTELYVDFKPNTDHTLNNVKIFEENLCFISSINHPRIGKKMSEICASQEQFAVFENAVINLEINKLVVDHSKIFHSNSFFALLTLIESGEHIGVLPVWLYEKFKHSFSIKKLSSDHALAPLPVYLSYRKKHVPANIVATIVEHFDAYDNHPHP